MATGDSQSAVCVFRHPDALPANVAALFGMAEESGVEYSCDWYGNLIDTVYPAHEGVKIYVLMRGSLALVALPVLVARASGSHQVQSLSNYYTALYGPAVRAGATVSDIAQVVSAIRKDNPSVASMTFKPMARDSDGYRGLLAALKLDGMRAFEFFCFGNWYLRVDGNWPGYLSSRKGTLRNTIKRLGKKLAADGGRIELFGAGDDLDRALNAYQRVYAASWKVPEPFPEFIPGLLRTCAKRGWLRLGVVWLKDEPVAAQIWIVQPGKANIYKVAYHEGYKAYAPGTLLTAMLMQHAFEHDRVAEVDYLIGDDPYKESWMSHRRERWGIVAYNPSSIGGLRGLSHQLAGRFLKAAMVALRKWRNRIFGEPGPPST